MGGVLASFSFYYQDLPTASQNSHSFTEGWWRSVFLLLGMREAPQNPSNDTQSQPLTVTLGGSLSHTAFHCQGGPT